MLPAIKEMKILKKVEEKLCKFALKHEKKNSMKGSFHNQFQAISEIIPAKCSFL